jgi:hypothetical protein
MRYLKILGLAAIVVMALMAFVGASTASADVLCTTNTTPACSSGWVVKEVVSSLTPNISFVFETTAGEELVTCTSSSISGTVEKQGKGVEPEGPISSLSFSGCNHTVTTIANGSIKIETRISIDGGGREKHTNTVTDLGSLVTVGILGVSCTYGPGANPISLGDLTVGEPATMDVSTVVNRVSGSILCPSTVRWTASFEVTNHKGLWVSEE